MHTVKVHHLTLGVDGGRSRAAGHRAAGVFGEVTLHTTRRCSVTLSFKTVVFLLEVQVMVPPLIQARGLPTGAGIGLRVSFRHGTGGNGHRALVRT